MATVRLLALALAYVTVSLNPAFAAIRLGAISVGAGYGYYSGPVWPGYSLPYFYGPSIYGPPFGDWYYPAPIYLVPQPDKGQVSLQGSVKDADVYLDDAYAGTTATLKKFWLAPGVYDLELRAKDNTPRKKRIYVLTGKTLKVSLE